MVQGTASVVLAGLLASLKLVGGTLADHTFLFLGAGEVRLDLSVFMCFFILNMFFFFSFLLTFVFLVSDIRLELV